MLIITATLELRALGKIGNQKHYFRLKKKNVLIGICTMTSNKIADRDGERRNSSGRVLSGIYGTSYGAISTTPAGGCISYCFHLCIAITGFLARLFELKSGCYSRTLI